MKHIYQVLWNDPTIHNTTSFDKPYKKYLTETISVGEILQDKDCVVVISTRPTDDTDSTDADGIVIPKSLIKSMDKV